MYKTDTCDVHAELLFFYVFIFEGTMKRAPYVCVCPSVRPCVCPSGLKMLKFASSLSFFGRFWLCFVLSDRAWCGLQNFYTEFWHSLIMQIYANLFKINEKYYFSVISWPILIMFILSDRAWCGLQNFYTEFWNSLIMQMYANLFKINEKCYFYGISWAILIPFVLSDRAWWGLRNFYTELWNSLVMQIYAKSMKMPPLLYSENHNRSALETGTYITHRVIYYPLVLKETSVVSVIL